VNAMANSGGTALMFAAVAGHLETCKVKEHYGTYISPADDAGLTLLSTLLCTKCDRAVNTLKLACML
jgi:hypothetical protein